MYELLSRSKREKGAIGKHTVLIYSDIFLYILIKIIHVFFFLVHDKIRL